jgi:hypothetical protein
VRARYIDPLECIWLGFASTIGMRVERSDEVYAAWDGAGTLTLSTPDAFDPDDSIAQMVLHEVCHALVQGDDSVALPDWGLDNQSERDVVREYACHRLQAALLEPLGLRWALAPTTDHRWYYDALPQDPLEGDSPEATLARGGYQRACTGAWSAPLALALRHTAQIAQWATAGAPADSVWRAEPPSRKG